MTGSVEIVFDDPGERLEVRREPLESCPIIARAGTASVPVRSARLSIPIRPLVFLARFVRSQLGREVSVRRTIGAKKDEFFVNGTHMPRDEVLNRLEAAGFSRSNPYYVVQQGKVVDLIKMGDAGRLGALQEIAGTSTYVRKREEAMQQLQRARLDRAQIDEMLTELESRLRDLGAEQTEFLAFQDLDGRRRALEYTILERELGEADGKLEDIKRAREQVRPPLEARSSALSLAPSALPPSPSSPPPPSPPPLLPHVIFNAPL